MKIQSDSFSCGIFAVLNAARALNISLSRRDVSKHSNTTQKGTNQKGILSALKNNCMSGKVINTSATDAVEQMNMALAESKPVILCVDNENHWITIIGRLGRKYIVFDSEKTKQNRAEHGVHLVERKSLMKRWINKGKYYGIIVSKRRQKKKVS